MPSPFPGMDPYLEDRDIWPGFHHSLAGEIKAQLNAVLDPNYYAEVEIQTVEGTIEISAPDVIRPDVSVLEPFIPTGQLSAPSGGAALAIPPAPMRRVAQTADRIKLRAVRVYTTNSDELVTSIEILSPYNKRVGQGIQEYRDKRIRLLDSSAHLVEIDLLRGGQRPALEIASKPLDADYILLVNRAGRIRISEIWPVALNQGLPIIPVPLVPPDSDVPLNLRAALDAVYTRSVYERRLKYNKPVPPPELRPAMAEWLAQRQQA